MKEEGISIEVEWLYSDSDKYIKEVGEDLAQMLELPFNFKGYNKTAEAS